MSVVTTELKLRVNAKIDECLDIAIRNHPDLDITFPTVTYKTKGMTAGKAFHGENRIDINPQLFVENVEDFLTRTVPHEVAHLVAESINRARFGGAHWRGYKKVGHGPLWKQIMVEFGCEPSRCHNYDVSNVRRKTSKKSFEWWCRCGQVSFTLGPKRHAKMLASGGTQYWLLGHSKCGGSTSIDTIMPAPTPKAAPKLTITKVASKGRTKLEICETLFDLHKSRAYNIQAFMIHGDCTAAGAATYYAKIKKSYASLTQG